VFSDHILTEVGSGFNHDDRWGHRAGEPNKAVICSIALARLRTDIKGNDLGNSNAVGMAQKLLLFWRKPARRCWWEGVELDNVRGVEGKLKVWIRRVWTLEMVGSPSELSCVHITNPTCRASLAFAKPPLQISRFVSVSTSLDLEMRTFTLEKHKRMTPSGHVSSTAFLIPPYIVTNVDVSYP
jgi:hypothetical protein